MGNNPNQDVAANQSADKFFILVPQTPLLGGLWHRSHQKIDMSTITEKQWEDIGRRFADSTPFETEIHFKKVTTSSKGEAPPVEWSLPSPYKTPSESEEISMDHIYEEKSNDFFSQANPLLQKNTDTNPLSFYQRLEEALQEEKKFPLVPNNHSADFPATLPAPAAEQPFILTRMFATRTPSNKEPSPTPDSSTQSPPEQAIPVSENKEQQSLLDRALGYFKRSPAPSASPNDEKGIEMTNRSSQDSQWQTDAVTATPIESKETKSQYVDVYTVKPVQDTDSTHISTAVIAVQMSEEDPLKHVSPISATQQPTLLSRLTAPWGRPTAVSMASSCAAQLLPTEGVLTMEVTADTTAAPKPNWKIFDDFIKKLDETQNFTITEPDVLGAPAFDPDPAQRLSTPIERHPTGNTAYMPGITIRGNERNQSITFVIAPEALTPIQWNDTGAKAHAAQYEKIKQEAFPITPEEKDASGAIITPAAQQKAKDRTNTPEHQRMAQHIPFQKAAEMHTPALIKMSMVCSDPAHLETLLSTIRMMELGKGTKASPRYDLSKVKMTEDLQKSHGPIVDAILRYQNTGSSPSKIVERTAALTEVMKAYSESPPLVGMKQHCSV